MTQQASMPADLLHRRRLLTVALSSVAAALSLIHI